MPRHSELGVGCVVEARVVEGIVDDQMRLLRLIPKVIVVAGGPGRLPGEELGDAVSACGGVAEGREPLELLEEERSVRERHVPAEPPLTQQ